MKNILSALLLISGNAFAGIPRTDCSTYDTGVQLVSKLPGQDFVKVTLDSEGRSKELAISELNILESNVHLIRESYGANGSYSKVYSATLNISKSNGSMPDAYTTNRGADGSLQVDVICKHSVF